MASNASLRLDLPDEMATAALAGRLARLARIGDLIALRGDLGMGKTAFARAFIRALTTPDEDVPSPTFTLVQSYDSAGGPIWHVDLYRLDSPDDALELDLEEAFHDAIVLIEWPDRLGPLLPVDRLDVTLASGAGPDARVALLEARGDWADRLRGMDR
jgi:tRNA threonylcarbamoyladenosine biosynthesis protein TsaE